MIQLGQPRPPKRQPKRLQAISTLIAYLLPFALLAEGKPALTQTSAYCQLTPDAIRQKETLRQAAVNGNTEAVSRYREILNQHSAQIQACRRQTWPQNQALWLRLYPCDLQPGVLDLVMDRIVNRGYNEVYVEVFYDGQALLPAADNPTPWPSVVRIPGQERADLLAQAIEKGRDRGLKVYAWMFTMNFGYNYSQRPDRLDALARNGRNQTSLTVNNDVVTEFDAAKGDSNHVFIDPYNMQAKRDYSNLVQAILRRRPDGVLFDYIRYPRLIGPASVATRVQDLWIYSNATQQALLQRALNQKGQELIRRFLSQGYITVGDVQAVDKLYPDEGEPLWQGRNAPQTQALAPAKNRQPLLQIELWQLSVAHALQGILDFVAMAAAPAQSQGIPTGVVFFPEANQVVGQGYDSRLQPWDRFPTTMEWHPMAYGVCGDVSCVVSQVQRVLAFAPSGANVRPVIAGNWGRSLGNRPSLEMQMAAIRQAAPQINSVSHFAYSWQEPEVDNARKACRF